MLKMRRQRGLSIVELMVGLAVGLFVVAAATLVVSSQLSSNRRLLLDTQIQQDLRVAADVIARDLRRAGAQLDSVARRYYWYPQAAAMTPVNANTLQTVAIGSSPPSATYRYLRGTGISTFGFRLNGSKLQAQTNSNWQDLTDETVMKVTSFTVTPSISTAMVLPCPNDCPGGGQACWPNVLVRQYTIDITAQAANDAAIVRSIRTRVHVANDQISTPVTSSLGVAAICPL